MKKTRRRRDSHPPRPSRRSSFVTNSGVDDGALHAGALVGLAVAVGAGDVELVGDLLAGAVEVISWEMASALTLRTLSAEHDVVGERLVVHELDGLALGDGDLVGLVVRTGRGDAARDERRVSDGRGRRTMFFSLRKSRGIDRSPRRAGDLAEARRSSSSDVSRDTGRRAGSRVARSEVRGVSGRETHEAELAVVAAELDGGGERGGGEEDGGGTDDGGLRGRDRGAGSFGVSLWKRVTTATSSIARRGRAGTRGRERAARAGTRANASAIARRPRDRTRARPRASRRPSGRTAASGRVIALAIGFPSRLGWFLSPGTRTSRPSREATGATAASWRRSRGP